MLLLPGTPPLQVNLRRSAQAKRFSLRVSRLDGRVTLTLPQRAKEADGIAFLHKHDAWLRETLSQMPLAQGALVGFGCEIMVEGKLLRITPSGARSVTIEADQLLVPQSAAPARIAAFLKVLARDRLARASDHYAAMVKRRYSRLTLRDTRSRWGSCTADGALMYSWRLIMAPPEVLDYVAAHEVAHLVEMNHSAAFWAVVERLCPDWRQQRKWLHDHGQSLHAYRFGEKE